MTFFIFPKTKAKIVKIVFTYCFNGSRWLHLSQLPSLAEMEALTNDLGIIDQCYQHLKSKKGQDAYLDAYKYAFSRRGKFLHEFIMFVSS